MAHMWEILCIRSAPAQLNNKEWVLLIILDRAPHVCIPWSKWLDTFPPFSWNTCMYASPNKSFTHLPYPLVFTRALQSKRKNTLWERFRGFLTRTQGEL